MSIHKKVERICVRCSDSYISCAEVADPVSDLKRKVDRSIKAYIQLPWWVKWIHIGIDVFFTILLWEALKLLI